jgi:putative transposase
MRGGNNVSVANANHLLYNKHMETLKHTRGCVYQTAYHLVWRPVYRRSILAEPVKTTLENLFRAIAHEHGMEILAVDVQPDHIHLFVSFPPALSISDAVKLLKGISARQLRLMFPDLRKKTRSDRLWAPSFYVGTAGHVSAETIRKYIASQEGHHGE